MNHTAAPHLLQECDILTALFVVLKWWMLLQLLRVLLRTQPASCRSKRAASSVPKLARMDGVIGLESVKDDLRQYVDYALHTEVYKRWGVRLPKGVLLVGPPGTGKTLLARSIASEMGIPMEVACGSEFVEMYVGVGAARVRALFGRAKKLGNCIVFIDEIDAIGRSRGQDHNSERDTTLNQLLVEMDGFESGSGIIVFAATNLAAQLDAALTRSGRFDRKVYFDAPNAEERKRMWTLFLGSIALPRGTSARSLAESSAGLTGADISNACNLAKMLAIRRGAGRRKLGTSDIQDAVDEIMVGREKRERTLTAPERARVAHHEAGHALLAHMLKSCEPPLKVSIVPRGEAALGFSQQRPDDARLHTRDAILARITVLLGGRAAERLIYGDVSTGAADDIERASRLVYRYVNEWGMDAETGPANAEMLTVPGARPPEDGHRRCTAILDALDEFAFVLVTNHAKTIKAIAAQLLRVETLGKEGLDELLPVHLHNKFQTQNVL
jgi:ATP-dependent metalloprotease FtsH